MMRFLKTNVAVAGICLALLGCYPQGPDITEDYDLVVTYNQGEYDFSTRNTYAMPDRIVKITGNLQEGDEPVFIPDAMAALILGQVRSNMTALGWTEVDIDDEPHLLLAPASWETTTLFYYYDYWYWWYGGYYPVWGYPPVSVSGYTTGTLVLTLIDPEMIGANGNPVLQWTGVANGILSGAYDANRINKAVDQMFTQSPYLKTN